jgi:predicted TIM-barrel fold metal-dependent hydrolase
MTRSADDYFIMDSECHLVPTHAKAEIAYFEQRRIWFEQCRGAVRGLLGQDPGEGVFKDATPEACIADMDEGGVDMAFVLPEKMMEMSGYSAPLSTNGYILQAVQENPERMMLCANVGPFKIRGVKNAIWELEYLATQHDMRAVKVYPVGDLPLNDRSLWPFYEKCEELGVTVFIHTGVAWVYPMTSAFCHPHLLEDVFNDFPALKVLAFHFAYPWYKELAVMAGAIPNLYVSMSALIFRSRVAPRLFAELVGETLYWGGEDKLVWSVDWLGQVSYADMVDRWLHFEMPEDLQEGYGYPEITEQTRRKVFGENLARLTGVEPRIRAKATAPYSPVTA